MLHTISIARPYTDPNETETDEQITNTLGLDLLGTGNAMTIREMLFAMEEPPTPERIEALKAVVNSICPGAMVLAHTPQRHASNLT